jgi:hypothetical protein
MKPKIKPRNPFVAVAKFRKAGAHEKTAKALRRHEKQNLAKTSKQPPESWHKCISPECASAMAPEDQACIAHALLSPPSPASALVRAFARHRNLICQI